MVYVFCAEHKTAVGYTSVSCTWNVYHHEIDQTSKRDYVWSMEAYGYAGVIPFSGVVWGDKREGAIRAQLHASVVKGEGGSGFCYINTSNKKKYLETTIMLWVD